MRAIFDAGGMFASQSQQDVYLTVLMDTSVQPELAAQAKQALYPATTNILMHIEPFFEQAPTIDTLADLCLIFANDSTVVGELVVQASRRELKIAVITLQPDHVLSLATKAGFPIDEAVLVAPGQEKVRVSAELQVVMEKLFAQLGEWVARNCSETRLALARAFSFVRTPLAREISRSTALQNGAIGAAVFVPGADMSLMTLNQAKMLLQIAAAFNLPIGKERLKELAVILLSAFGFRAISRRLAGYVPLLGWAIKGGIGYSSTLALGFAATEYFTKGGDMSGLGKFLRGHLDSRRQKNPSTTAAAETFIEIKVDKTGDSI